MSSELNFRCDKVEDTVTVFVSGEVDIYTSQNLKDKLYNIIESNKTDISVDCKELNYIDSTGLGIFVGALKKSRQLGKTIYLLNLKDNIKKLFIITGLDKVFEIA